MLNHTLVKKLKFDKIKEVDLKNYRNPDYIKISKAAIKYSDALIFGSEKINPELEELVRSTEKPLLEFLGDDNYITVYNDFYEKLLKHKRN
jgi:starch synthase